MRLPLQHRTVQKRNGFTLIELLVVIAILALLMALTLGVMSKVYSYLDETKVNAEVNRLAESCNLFKSQFGRYPPGKIILCENPAAYANIISGALAPPATSGLSVAQWSALGSYSVDYLSSIFPGINLTGAVLHDWNGNGSLDNPMLLDGNQCLVYFLGGMRYGTNTPIGFNTDKTLPTVQTNGARLGPFYADFDAGRFDTTYGYGAAAGFYPSYRDPYGTPYAYFAIRFPGMSNYANAYFPGPLVTPPAPNDCHLLTTMAGPVYFVPYFQGTVPAVLPANWQAATTTSFKFVKGDTFQIVSAGKDKLFGTGGQWNQADPENSLFVPTSVIPAVTTDMLQANYDNITNFAGGRVVPK